MNEIKSINTVYNNAILISATDEIKEYITEIVAFVPKNKSDEWFVNINYNLIEPYDKLHYMQHINGLITFINSKDPEKKIQFELSDDSTIVHEGNHDEISFQDPLDNKNIGIDIFYDENKNAIVKKIEIETNNTNKITNDKTFIDYDNLRLDHGSIEASFTPGGIATIQAHSDDCPTLIFFATDYYYNNYIDFNPWHI